MRNLILCVPARERVLVGQDHAFHTNITLNPPAMAGSERAPLDIAVALDVSGSMSGSKIKVAKQSLLKLVEHLRAEDSLAVVLFTDWVETLIPPTKMTMGNKEKARKALHSVRSHSSTNLSGGLFKALDHLKESASTEKGCVRRCLIFTDGQANQGIRDPHQLASAALEYRDGIGISAFGYGNDHDPVLLEKISQDGEFYYIDTPDKILTAFGAELGGLVSTFAQNVRLTLTPADGVEIVEVMNDLTVREDGSSVVVDCDDLLAEQEYSVVLEVKVAKRDNTHPRGVSLIKATVSYFDVGANKKETQTASLKVRFVNAGKEDTKDDERVVNARALQMSVQAQAEALKLADCGDYVGSQQILYAASEDLRGIGFGDAVQPLIEVNEALAKENFTAEAYLVGGSGQARSLRKGLSRRRMSSVKAKGGVAMGNLYGETKDQVALAQDFEESDAAGDLDVVEEKSASQGSSVSKSRSCLTRE
jgi:Ca-activated chloride channel homolog